ncbi:unnamed protein product, partial [Heterosigma akashiwo]
PARGLQVLRLRLHAGGALGELGRGRDLALKVKEGEEEAWRTSQGDAGACSSRAWPRRTCSRPSWRPTCWSSSRTPPCRTSSTPCGSTTTGSVL